MYHKSNFEGKLKTALAVERNRMAATLGRAPEFILLSGEGQETLACTEKIPAFLKKNQVETLICNGIGNCMKDLLTSMGIEVIPGISGEVCEVVASYRAGKLVPGEKYSCADHGRTCGECPGSF